MKLDPTPFIRPIFYGLMVAILSGFHCSNIQTEDVTSRYTPSGNVTRSYTLSGDRLQVDTHC